MIDFSPRYDKEKQALRLEVNFERSWLLLSFCWNRPLGITYDGVFKRVAYFVHTADIVCTDGTEYKAKFWTIGFFMFSVIFSKAYLKQANS